MMIPDRRLTIPLPMMVPQHAERLFPLTTAPKSPARTRERVSRDRFKPSFLSAETFHYHDDEVRRVLATIENIICLDRSLDIVVEGSVVKHFPGPVDLVKHIVLDIVSLFFQPLNPLSQFK